MRMTWGSFLQWYRCVVLRYGYARYLQLDPEQFLLSWKDITAVKTELTTSTRSPTTQDGKGPAMQEVGHFCR
jgi:hypothetical protein